MTTKQKNATYSLLVTGIHDAVRTRNNGYIHMITFRDSDGGVYYAEEYEQSSTSKFVKDQINTFEVTNPGINNSPDWVRFKSAATTNGISCSTGVKAEVLPPQTSKDDMIIAQSAFKCAVDYGIKYKFDEDKIIDLAYKWAGNIKIIAKQIAEDLI